MCGGVGEALASVDPFPAIGQGLSEVDKFVGREIPGGWVTVGLTAAIRPGLAEPLGLGSPRKLPIALSPGIPSLPKALKICPKPRTFVFAPIIPLSFAIISYYVTKSNKHL